MQRTKCIGILRVSVLQGKSAEKKFEIAKLEKNILEMH